MNEQKKLKIALVGSGHANGGGLLATGFKSAGNWGLQHARIFANRQDVDFAAIVGTHEDIVTARAEEYGTKGYTDLEEMLSKENPDLVSVCLPNQKHFDTTMKLIKAGIPVLAEKPLVFDLREAETLLNEAAKRNLFFAINFNHRYAKPVKLAYQAVKDNKIGDLTFASWRFGGEGSSSHPHANLIETQCHGFDMLEYLCGPIQSIMAEMTDKTGKGFRTLCLSLKFENGAVGSLIGSYDSSYAYRDTHRLELDGTCGRAVIHDTVRQYEYQARGNETAEVWQAGYFNDVEREFHRMMDKHIGDLLEALREGKEPPIHAAAGYRALQLAYASIESFETGKRVKV